VSLLITELSFTDTVRSQRITLAVMVGSLLAAVLAGVLLRFRARAREKADSVANLSTM